MRRSGWFVLLSPLMGRPLGSARAVGPALGLFPARRSLRVLCLGLRSILEAWLVLLFLLFFWLFQRPVVAQVPGTPGQSPLVLEGALVLVGEELTPRQLDVVVVNGRIDALLEAGDTLPAGAEILDLKGRTILPGFVDTHAHVTLGPVEGRLVDGVPSVRMISDPEVASRSLRTLLAYGVTAARDPGGPTNKTVAVRNALAADVLVGPRMVVAGDVIDSTPFEGLTARVQTVEQVRAEVRRQAEAGVDLIKLYAGLSPKLLAAGTDEAKKHGLPAVAHLLSTTWEEGAEAGLQSILHIVPGSPKMLPADRRPMYMKDMTSTVFMWTWFEFVDFEDPLITSTISAMVRNKTWLDPTLVAFEGAVRGQEPERTTELPELSLAAPSLVENWRRSFRFDLGWTDHHYERAKASWPRVLEFTKLLHDAGVRLTAGTDANNPWTVPGPSFHRELDLLAQAGISNAEVLRIATRNGAEVIGLLDQIGTIEVGKVADLVVLRNNPLDDLSATRDIELVLAEGRRWRPEQLLEGLER